MFHQVVLKIVEREDKKLNTVIHYLVAISDAGCKIDLVISLTSFDAYEKNTFIKYKLE